MARKKKQQETKLRSDAQKFLTIVPEEYVFKCHDGRVLENMKELGDALATMADETFAYHSNSEKKDFSNWVRDVIGDERLAMDLEMCLDRVQAARIVAASCRPSRSRMIPTLSHISERKCAGVGSVHVLALFL